MSKCLVLAPAAILSGAQCFCLDCDRGTVWIVTSSDLCCIEDGKVMKTVSYSTYIMYLVLHCTDEAQLGQNSCLQLHISSSLFVLMHDDRIVIHPLLYCITINIPIR